MPKAHEIQVIVELTHHTLHALRAVNGTIEAGGECILENKVALEALIGAVVPGWKTEGVRADCVWPDAIAWRLSTDTEAFLDRTSDSLRAIAAATRGSSRAPFAYAVCNAGDGGAITPNGTERWILASATRESLEQVSGSLPGSKVESRGARPSAFARVGAIAGVLRANGKGSVALWDIGTDRSHLVLITENGVEGVAPCAAGLNAIYEAVQMALKLKFRGAGARLFFSDGYDFTDPGPKICATVGASLKQALSLLPQHSGPPALACIGFTGKQAWFTRGTAAAAGTTAWEPDIKGLAGDLGLSFADDAVREAFTPASAGLLELLGSRLRARVAWHPAWVEAEAPPEDVEEEPLPGDEAEPLAPPVPAPFRAKPALTHEGAAAPPGFAARQPRPVGDPAETAPAEAPGEPPRPAISFPPQRPSATPGTAPSFPATALPPPEPAPEPGSPSPPPGAPPSAGSGAKKAPPAGAAPAKRVTSLPFDTSRLKPAVPAEAVAGEKEEVQPKSKVGRYVGIVAAAALLFAATAVALDYWMQKIKEHELEQQEALAHHLAEVRVRDSEQMAKASAEKARKDAQAAIEATQRQAEDAARQKVLAEVERINRLPGVLLVATVPAAASVSIDGAAPLKSPVRVEGVASGPHRVRISLFEYETVDLNTTIKGTKTTDLGTVKLESSLGTLEVSSIPDSLDFVVHTAADPAGKPFRIGRTPAIFTGIVRGDYLVTFARPGCNDHVEKVTVVRAATTPVVTKYQDGSLELTSEPSGAWVDKDGMRLGSTPLVLHDLTPKQASFELTLPGYDPTPITCEIPEGQTLKLTAQLLRRDRIFNPAEVKSLPVTYECPQPELSPSQRRMNAEAVVSFVVQRDGSVVDVKVEKTTDDDIGRRCATAVARWKFHPGTAADDRTVDVRMEVPFKFAATDS